MIVTSKEWYLPAMINAITLFKEPNYFYVDRSVYDAAVILEDRYTIASLLEIIDKDNNSDAIDWFYENAPSPINGLAPVLSLAAEGIECTLEDCCGALHVITNTIGIKNYLQQPKEIRKGVEFSLRVKDEYIMAWENFFALSIPYNDRNKYASHGQGNYNQGQEDGDVEFEARDLGDGNVLVDDSMFADAMLDFEKAMNGETPLEEVEVVDDEVVLENNEEMTEAEKIKRLMRGEN